MILENMIKIQEVYILLKEQMMLLKMLRIFIKKNLKKLDLNITINNLDLVEELMIIFKMYQMMKKGI